MSEIRRGFCPCLPYIEILKDYPDFEGAKTKE